MRGLEPPRPCEHLNLNHWQILASVRLDCPGDGLRLVKVPSSGVGTRPDKDNFKDSVGAGPSSWNVAKHAAGILGLLGPTDAAGRRLAVRCGREEASLLRHPQPPLRAASCASTRR